ncbi:cupin domain-containing protein [Streptomyces sp. MAR4 CNX-425]|uniref:cupin domain-containing protein n=1 Tax=Streptomyces sp. MAR4 CNX-425 TaxID=3406343 RepID=UPI003B5143EE
MTSLVVPPGQGRKLITKAQEVTFKVTGADNGFASTFEVVVPPGFDVGAHVHQDAKEFFYVLEGELEVFAFEPVARTEDTWHNWESPEGAKPLRGGPGSCMFVDSGTPHAFRNPTDTPTRMLFQSSPPPDHERYFEEICEIFSSGETVDPGAVQLLRDRYDVNQITPLRYG